MVKKASELVTFYHNENGPVISNCNRHIFKKDNLYFKDIGGNGLWKDYDDWRLPPRKRAQLLVKDLTVDEKIGLLFIDSWKTGMEQQNKRYVDETGLLDELPVKKNKSIFASQSTLKTSDALTIWFVRNLILRSNPKPNELTDWINQLNYVAESCRHFVPVKVVANSKNENGKVIFGMNDGNSGFTTWPGTLGIAAGAKGSGLQVIDDFARCVKQQWDTVGLKKGYMYMADLATDPRWQRTYGTFGEDPEFNAKIFSHLVPLIQGSENGVTSDGVALTVKHFPGGGARDNGFDPHYAMGQWNVYQTKDSLKKYHLPAFQAAIDKNVSAIMPYYAKPSKNKSALQTDLNNQPIDFKPYGFAYNKIIIDDLLRKQLGFKGYLNSDSGITHSMSWGVEQLDVPERVALALNTGIDLISGAFDLGDAKEAYRRSQEGYYDNHQIPDGFTREQLELTLDTIDRAVINTLEESFKLGLFENPYRDVQKVIDLFECEDENAYKAHLQSVVLLKNDGTLPLKQNNDSLFYIEVFQKDGSESNKATLELKKQLNSLINITDQVEKANYALLFIDPSSGGYFEATTGYLELDICENKTVVKVDNEGKPLKETYQETTLANVKKIEAIYKQIHLNKGKVISNLNITLPWLVGNIETNCDCLLAGFDTSLMAVIDVIFGNYAPTGKLPITLPRNDEVIKVDSMGVCASPNDVPGYDKDKYMADSLKDENGKAYAYRDQAGNYYELNFGLHY